MVFISFIVPFSNLATANLMVDAIYEGGAATNAGADPICKLIPGVANLGGFRSSGRGQDKNLVVLYTSGSDTDWPDHLDITTGRFVYYGDNRTSGPIHATPLGGNRILRRVFELLHSSHAQDLKKIPPFLVFEKHETANSSRSVQFKGLAVPGYRGLPETEDLVAVWKSTSGQRFQNYRAVFTILDTAQIDRGWLVDLVAGVSTGLHVPEAWKIWSNTRAYRPLYAPLTLDFRTVAQQVPDSPEKIAIVRQIYNRFLDNPIAFEPLAAKLFEMQSNQLGVVDEITRGVRDGGRDAIGRYRLGIAHDPIYVEFALEAKLYCPPIGGMRGHHVGVREVARLISRIRNRQFGVLVTTSVIGRQAYEEVRKDRHPIIFISGRDIADLLIASGIHTPNSVNALIDNLPNSLV